MGRGKKLPGVLRWKLILLPRISDTRCKRIVKRIGDKIVKQKNRWKGFTSFRLARMEYIYYAYRIRYLKYAGVNSKKKGVKVATGALNSLRNQLRDIVLSDNVDEANRWQAINILIGQDSFKTLYDIAREQKALSHMLDVNGHKQPVAFYIIDNFPSDCDNFLLNLAFAWAARSQGDLVGRALDKIESPKTLLTLCMFLKNNPQHIHQVERAVVRIGNMVMENLYKLVYQEHYGKRAVDEKLNTVNQLKEFVTNEQLIDYLASLKKYNPEAESEWIELHEKSMLHSAHKALETIVLIFGEDKITSINSVDPNKEMKLVQRAINSMVVEGMITNFSEHITNTSKKSYCTKRISELKNGEIDSLGRENMLEREIDCLLSANSNEADQISALTTINDSEKDEEGNSIGLSSSKYTYLVATMNDRLQKNMKGQPSYPPLERNVGYEFCKLYRQSQGKEGHKFKPKDDNPAVLECIHCGWTDTNTDLNPAMFNYPAQGIITKSK